MATLNENDLAALASAVNQLERPGLAGKLAEAVGTPVEKLLQRLPDSIQEQINGVTEDSLSKALRVAIKTLDGEARGGSPWNLSHKVAATLTGVTGGLFGAPALFAELPVTTVIMLRSIADIARSKGEDLSDPAVRLACLEVFALGSGGRNAPDAAVDIVIDHETGQAAEREEEFIRATYFVARAAMAQQVTAAAEMLKRGATTGGKTALTRLISRIASRFGVAVSEKAAAQAVPIVGAIGGGLVNVLFMSHFQDTAEAHFSVRRLERAYGAETVRREYEALAQRKRD
jgi:hypothetical protein